MKQVKKVVSILALSMLSSWAEPTWDLEPSILNASVGGEIYKDWLPSTGNFAYMESMPTRSLHLQVVRRSKPLSWFGVIGGLSYGWTDDFRGVSHSLWVPEKLKPATVDYVQHQGRFEQLSAGMDLSWLGKYMGVGLQLSPGVVIAHMDQQVDIGSCTYSNDVSDIFKNLFSFTFTAGQSEPGVTCHASYEQRQNSDFTDYSFNFTGLVYVRLMPSWPISIDWVSSGSKFDGGTGVRVKWNFLR